MESIGGCSRARALAALAAVLIATVAAVRGFAGALAALPPAPEVDLAALLHLSALGALIGCGVWAGAVLLAALARPRVALRLCPRACRPLLVLVCGAGVAAAMAMPSYASGDGAAHGPASLPPLGRVSGGTSPPARARAASEAVPQIVVHAGDSLWSLVAARHPHDDEETLARRVARLYAGNRDRIGADPNLIRPGLRLRPTDRDPS